MKDFQSVIDSKTENELKLTIEEKEEKSAFRKMLEQALPLASPLLLSLVTGPLNTASILLQVTAKGSSP
jgi:hypothetical protein